MDLRRQQELGTFAVAIVAVIGILAVAYVILHMLNAQPMFQHEDNDGFLPNINVMSR